MNAERFPDSSERPVLSLILCSRNDRYMGDPRWRLQTALNYFAQNASALGRESQVEVIVADWGSSVPLHTVLQLTSAARRIVSFVVIPHDLAQRLQRDSPFSEVHALNAAARRARGDYIGRIDQDTLVGRRFLRLFFELHEEKRHLSTPLSSTFLFSSRRGIPYRFSDLHPAYPHVERFVRLFGPFLRVSDNTHKDVFWTTDVGLCLFHRNGWHACGGYNESLIYYDWMEIDLILRAKQNYTIVDLGKLVDYDFYHLNHYQETSLRSAVLHPRARGAKRNPPIHDLYTAPEVVQPSGKTWGLVGYPLKVLSASAGEGDTGPDGLAKSGNDRLTFTPLLVTVGLRMAGDGPPLLAFRAASVYRKWRRRARITLERIEGRPVRRWPSLLTELWTEKRQSRNEGVSGAQQR